MRRDGLKGLLPYIRAVDAVVAAAHDGYSRLGFLSPGCTQGTGDSSEFPNPVFHPNLTHVLTLTCCFAERQETRR